MSDELKQESGVLPEEAKAETQAEAQAVVLPAEEAPVPPSVGEQLRLAREAIGLTLNEAAHTLMLAPRQIEALENNQWDKLPGDTFVRGFVRNYGKLLKLDPNALIAQLQSEQQSAQPNIEMPQSLAAELPQAMHAKKRDKATVLAAFGLVGVALLVYFLLPEDLLKPSPPADKAVLAESADKPADAAPAAAGNDGTQTPVAGGTPVAINPTPLAEAGAAAPAATTSAVPAAGNGVAGSGAVASAVAAPLPATPAPATAPAAPAAAPAVAPASAPAKPAVVDAAKAVAAPATPAVTAAPAPSASTTASIPPGATRLKFTFTDSSWVEVKDAKGQLLVSSNHTGGSEREVAGAGPLSITVGKASRVRLLVNGKPVDLQPSANDVARLTLP